MIVISKQYNDIQNFIKNSFLKIMNNIKNEGKFSNNKKLNEIEARILLQIDLKSVDYKTLNQNLNDELKKLNLKLQNLNTKYSLALDEITAFKDQIKNKDIQLDRQTKEINDQAKIISDLEEENLKLKNYTDNINKTNETVTELTTKLTHYDVNK